MFSLKLKGIAESIGQFYLNKNNGDYDKTAKEIIETNFTKLEVTEDDVVIITTARPGLLIGKKGENVDKLQAFLGRKIKILEEMELLNDLLIPYPPEYEEDYCDSLYDVNDDIEFQNPTDYEVEQGNYIFYDDLDNNHSHLDDSDLNP